jgi:hypothetical protein
VRVEEEVLSGRTQLDLLERVEPAAAEQVQKVQLQQQPVELTPAVVVVVVVLAAAEIWAEPVDQEL